MEPHDPSADPGADTTTDSVNTDPVGVSRIRPAALAAVVANVGIVLTGGIVRVTESGLGCERWPTCDGSSIVPVVSPGEGRHTWIEYGNRLLTFVVLAAVIAVLVAVRRHAPDRRDLVRLAWLQVGGVVAQAVLGGITVLTGLSPLVVAAHLLVSMAIIAAAVWLHAEVSRASMAADEHPGRLRPLANPLLFAAGLVVVLGTLVTASGPHAGDPGTPRLALDIRTMAFAHADAVWLLVGLSVATTLAAWATGARRVAAAGRVLLAVEVAQGAIGYLQYALGVPPLLVSLHLLGAALVWVAALRVAFHLRLPLAAP